MMKPLVVKKDTKNGKNTARNLEMKKTAVMLRENVTENGEKRTLMVKKKCQGKWREENGEIEGRGPWWGPRGRPGYSRGGRGHGGHRGGRGGWRKFQEMEDDSDSIEETRPVEEIKKEINSLKEEVVVLVTKKKALWEELVALKIQIKNLRQNGGAGDEILKVREQIMEKKKVCRGYQGQIANSKNRIWKMKNALVMRVD